MNRFITAIKAFWTVLKAEEVGDYKHIEVSRMGTIVQYYWSRESRVNYIYKELDGKLSKEAINKWLIRK